MIKVLIVDDDKLARKGLISIVPWSECGMVVVGEAANGQKALEWLETNSQVDLVVVDLAMPVMTGLEFIEKSKVEFPELRHVVLSFYEDFQSVQSALRLGALDYISKMQLDQYDCAEIFARVGKMMLETKSESTIEVPQSVEDEPAWSNQQSQWLEFHWLFTEEAFELCLEETKRLKPSLQQVEHLLVRINDHGKNLCSCEQFPIPQIKSSASCLEWLRKYRIYLAEQILTGKDSSILSSIFRAVNYMRTHLHDPLSTDYVAKKVSLSRSYFATNFKKAVGVPFNAFLRIERVKMAKNLLKAGEATVSTVAKQVGYEDEKYFSRIFTEYTGMSLMAFQNQQSKSH